MNLTVLRARVMLAVSRPPVEDGAVCVAGNCIAWAGRWRDLPEAEQSRAFDLGEVILMPGLVNAHCHLDYTHMAGELAPTASFIDWLKLITMNKMGWTYSDYASSWLAGAKMLVRRARPRSATLNSRLSCCRKSGRPRRSGFVRSLK